MFFVGQVAKFENFFKRIIKNDDLKAKFSSKNQN